MTSRTLQSLNTTTGLQLMQNRMEGREQMTRIWKETVVVGLALGTEESHEGTQGMVFPG
jgi:hypothetical protein